MQAIAEYFRDLAAQDRYFGAEPPTPDAEMLHRIAEREVQRRVESQVQENGIILRQQADHSLSQTVPAPFALASAASTAAAPAAMMAAAAPAAATPNQNAEATPPQPSEITDKLARIRAAVAKSEAVEDAAPRTAPDADLPDSADPEQPEFEDTLASLMAEDMPEETAGHAEDAEIVAFDASDMADDSPAASEDIVSDDESADEDTSLEPVTEAPVAAQPDTQDNSDEYDDYGLFDEDEDAPQNSAPASVSSALDAMQPVAAEQTMDAQDDSFEDEFEDEFEPDDADSAADSAPAHPEPLEAPAAELSQRQPEASHAAPAKSVLAEEMDEDDFEAELEREMQDAARLEQERHSIETLRNEIRDILGRTGLNQSSESSLVEELADIEKEAIIRHPHFNRKAKKRIPGDTESTAERLLETAKSALGERDSKRRRETFEHIKVAVAATRAEEIVEGPRRRDIEQDREIDKYRASMDAPAPLDPALVRAAARARATQDDKAANDADYDIWEKDEVSLDSAPVVEAAAPQRAPATMRMADAPAEVTAKAPRAAEADAFAAQDDDSAELNPRPRRPAVATARRTERPLSGRTPLVLVSEQRVDAATAASGPVRPRRIRASQAAETIVPDVDGTALGQDTVETFKAFADDVDAWLLDDQIEAAAAYSTHILGQEEFSRPDLMKLVLAYNEGKEVSREDMLRGFGTLLREGRLERGNAGAFRLAPASEYDEPARKYAQR
ncbi:hypothetical protein [Roseibaca calidilacus]|nr:hypothetical protein [Roseibaca calidilacus]